MTLGDPDMSWSLRGPQPVSKRQELLQEATRIVTNNRNADYGEPEDAFGLIADYWSLYLGKKYGVTLAATDVPLLMALLKLARLTTNPSHHDSQVDVAGYMACLAELGEERT
jgi:hypothetical protein